MIPLLRSADVAAATANDNDSFAAPSPAAQILKGKIINGSGFSTALLETNTTDLSISDATGRLPKSERPASPVVERRGGARRL